MAADAVLVVVKRVKPVSASLARQAEGQAGTLWGRRRSAYRERDAQTLLHGLHWNPPVQPQNTIAEGKLTAGGRL